MLLCQLLPAFVLLSLASAAPSGQPVRVPAGTVNYGDLRKESPVSSNNPDGSFSSVSVVSLFQPLPKEFGNITPACDYISHLRFKHNDGPADSTKADRILSFMPGTLAGASSFDKMARNIIYESKKLGLFVEVWALDRRANCLDDNTGILAGVKSGNYQDAIDYYYKGKVIDGQKFDGFYGNMDKKLDFLAEVGVDQTIQDWHAVVNAEIPDPVYRATKHYASGHSLGGILTAYFANYDNANGTDPGYNAAAGFIAFDSVIRPTLGPSSTATNPLGFIIEPLLTVGFDLFQAGVKTGLAPRSLLTALPIVLTPEVTQFTGLIGLLAHLNGSALVPFQDMPDNIVLTSVSQAIFSETILNYVTVTPKWNTFKMTRDAFMGCFFSDRIDPLGFLQVSIGFPTGGAIGEKTFPFGRYDDALGLKPLSDVLPVLSALDTAPYPLAVPTDNGGLLNLSQPTYTWLNYDQIADDGSNVAKTPSGNPFINSSSQVSDTSDFARALAEFPLDYTEHYYPIRVTSDALFDGAGVKGAVNNNIHKDGYKQRPSIAFVGSEGIAIGLNLTNVTYTIAPGYNHLDVLSASRKQNLGREELVSIGTAKFMSKLGSGIIS